MGTRFHHVVLLFSIVSVISKTLSAVPFGLSAACITEDTANQDQRKLIVLLVDATRWDYVSRDPELQGFPRLAREGSKAQYVIPIFPSNSYPNWYTIVTGLYSENHGFVENFMFDRETGDFFLMYPHPNVSHPHWWREAEPLWITAEKYGIKSALYGNFGCDVEIAGRKASHCERHRHLADVDSMLNTTRMAIDDLLDKFVNQSYRLAMIHFSGVDRTGHLFGPDAPQTRQAVKDIDIVINELQDKLEEMNLSDTVNLVVLSDHGMFDLNQAERLINMSNILDQDDIQLFMELGSTAMILPAEGKLNKVYNDLVRANESGMQVYKKGDIPEHFHIKNSLRTLPILLVADKKSFIYPFDNPRKAIPPINGVRYNGFHGYDPYITEEMRAIFFARGPAFKKGHAIPFLHMVDHYNLLCHLIGIQPLPNNGSWTRVEEMLI